MIYDHIKNIVLYKGISAALDVALDYIAAAKMPLEDGTTLLEHGVKAVVSSYVTKEVNPKGYEAHLKYADVQFLLEGAEDIRLPMCNSSWRARRTSAAARSSS